MSIFRRIWASLPDDTVRVAAVALLMPVLFMLYQLGSTQFTGRVIFSLSLGALGVLVGWLIQERHDDAGYFVGACAIGTMFAAIASLLALTDPTWTWRTIMAGSQANIVLGWGLLWRIRKKWLSRTLARWAFAASAVGFAVYVLTNFGLPDPLFLDHGGWGFTEPKGIVRRVLDLPLDLALSVSLWTAITLTLRRWLLLHLNVR